MNEEKKIDLKVDSAIAARRVIDAISLVAKRDEKNGSQPKVDLEAIVHKVVNKRKKQSKE